MRHTFLLRSWRICLAYMAGVSLLAGKAHAQRERKVSRDSLPLYYEFQVTETARVLEWQKPVYPDTLKAKKIEGEVLIQFVVDTLGQMEKSTVRVLRATNPAFEAAVRATLSSTRFTPAVREGKRVRQVMDQPFVFSVKK